MKQLNVRMPDELHAALKVLAEHENRSLNGQIVHVLGQRVAREEVREMNAIPLPPEGGSPLAQR